MKREIITTADGSHTVAIPEMGVTYHSHHGAVQESMHVFIEAGLRWYTGQSDPTGPAGQATCKATANPENFTSGQTSKASKPIRIFEMGFGTGLNAYLTALEAEKLHLPINYTAVEKFPLTPEEAAALNYAPENQPLFESLHRSAWNGEESITPYFTLTKLQTTLEAFTAPNPFDIVYFDAFAPTAQPELWTEAIFSGLHTLMNEGGVLVTYCSKGVVRRAMQAAGFTVTKIPGPPGKREMVRAVRS